MPSSKNTHTFAVTLPLYSVAVVGSQLAKHPEVLGSGADSADTAALGVAINRLVADVLDNRISGGASEKLDTLFGEIAPEAAHSWNSRSEYLESVAQEAFRVALHFLAGQVAAMPEFANSHAGKKWLERFAVAFEYECTPLDFAPTFSIPVSSYSDACTRLWRDRENAFAAELIASAEAWVETLPPPVPEIVRRAIRDGWTSPHDPAVRYTLASVWNECFCYGLKYASSSDLAFVISIFDILADGQNEIQLKLVSDEDQSIPVEAEECNPEKEVKLDARSAALLDRIRGILSVSPQLELFCAKHGEIRYKNHEVMRQFRLADALIERGVASEDVEGRVRLLGEIIGIYRNALGMQIRDDCPQLWALVQYKLGNILYIRFKIDARAGHVHLFDESIAAFRSALEVYTREGLPREWAMVQNSLATVLFEYADVCEGTKQTQLLRAALVACRLTLEVQTREAFPQEWAEAQENLGNILYAQTEMLEGAKKVPLFSEAVAAYRNALEVVTREERPQDWATMQEGLAIILAQQSDMSDGVTCKRLRNEAIAAYRHVLEVWTRESHPQEWARAQYELAVILEDQAVEYEFDREVQARLLRESIAVFHDLLEVRTRAVDPCDWAKKQTDLVFALTNLADITTDVNEKTRLRREAIICAEDALQVCIEQNLSEQRRALQELLPVFRRNLERDIFNKGR